jgi:hypothetical protein
MGTTRGFEILVARLTATEQKTIFPLCHNEITLENESCHGGRHEMAAG